MKKFSILIILLSVFLIISCESTEKAEPVEQPAVEEITIVEEPESQEEPFIEEPAVEEIVEIEEEILEEEPVVEEVTGDDEEYARSINNMEGSVSKEDFLEDKRDILSRIAKLDEIMKQGDFLTWKTFVDQESLSYWSLRGNLRKVSAKLPVKGLQLNTLEDYFKFVFIQSRIGRQIDEIRYVSDTYVKAFQVTDDQDVVYYYFEKINGIWKVNLPALTD